MTADQHDLVHERLEQAAALLASLRMLCSDSGPSPQILESSLWGVETLVLQAKTVLVE